MNDISFMRKSYSKNQLTKENLHLDPFVQFELWFNEAMNEHILEPNAFTLATVGIDLKPTQRTVLLKMYDKSGFTFFSNYTSKKAKQIEENPNVSAHFAWLSLERQIRIEGSIEKISKAESLKYFLSRPKGSQLGAWVSHQSQIISSKSLLKSKFEEIKKKFANREIPLPDFWGGYKIVPNYFEFWQGGQDRLHDRFAYEIQEDKSWKISRLEP